MLSTLPPKKAKNKEGFQGEGFVTSTQSLSLSGLSLGIWVATMMIYQLLFALNLCPKYSAFCLLTSLILSVMGSMYVVSRMQTRADFSTKFFLVLMNTFLIYSSANGIQAGNSAISKDDKDVTCETAAIIPFISSRPWLQDKKSIDSIAVLNQQVRDLDKNDILSSQQDTIAVLRDMLAILETGIATRDSLNSKMAEEIKNFEELRQQWRDSSRAKPWFTDGRYNPVEVYLDTIVYRGYYKKLFRE